MKVCIYGAGAIGCWIGTRLASAGATVSAVARGATLAALRTHGLGLHENGQTLQMPVDASDQPLQLGQQDLIVLAVKTPAIPAVAADIDPLLGAHTLVLTAMNGIPWWFFDGFEGPYAGTRLQTIDPHGHVAGAIPGQRVIGCVVHASCSLEAPGFARHHFGNRLIIGEPSGPPSTRLAQLGSLLQQAGFEAVLSQRIQKDIWYKLWGNMTVNPISALTGATGDRIMADPLVRDFMSRVMLEAREIGARIGIPITQEPEDRHHITAQLGAFKTSMLQDVETGRPVELDALVSVVKELGELTGVPTPFTNALLGLSRLQAQVRGLY